MTRMPHACAGLLACLLFWGHPVPAHALCVPDVEQNRPLLGDHYLYTPYNTNIRIFVDDPNSVDVGQPFGQIQLHMAPNSWGPRPQPYFACSGAGHVEIVGQGQPILGDVYPSDLAGIGFRINIGGRRLPLREQRSVSSYPGPTDVLATIALVRTGQISATGPFSQTFAYERVDGQTLFEYQLPTLTTTPPQQPTCLLHHIDPVDLGTHAASRFTGVGTVTEARDFQVELTCSGGSAGTRTKAYATLTDNTDPGNVSDVLSLYASRVSGLGVEILRNGSPLHFGQQTAAPGSPNVWEAGTIVPGQASLRIALQARYRQTAISVTGGGPAHAQALLTINYR